MKHINAREYNITVRYGNFEGEGCYEAKIKELPTIAEYADSYEEAYLLAIDSIETLADMYAEQGKTFPAPDNTETSAYSGRVTLRVPKSLHQSLSEKAERELVSLNLLLTNILAAYAGFGAQLQDTKDSWHNLEKEKRASQTAQVHNIRDYQQAVNG